MSGLLEAGLAEMGARASDAGLVGADAAAFRVEVPVGTRPGR